MDAFAIFPESKSVLVQRLVRLPHLNDKVAEAMLLAVGKVSFVDSAVEPGVHAIAVLNVIHELAFVFSAISLDQCAVSLFDALIPLTRVSFTFCIEMRSKSMHHVLSPMPGVAPAISPGEGTQPLFDVGLIVALISLAILPRFLS